MKALPIFLKDVENNNCVENTKLNLSEVTGFLPFFGIACNGYSTSDIKKLGKALASGNCKPGLTIYLQRNYIGNKGAEALSEGLKSPNRPVNLTLSLWGNVIDDKGLRAIMDALVAGPATAGVNIILSGRPAGPGSDMCACSYGSNHITDKGAEIFAAALEKMIVNNNCPQNLEFDFTETNIGNKGAHAIVNALESSMKKNPAPQTITLKIPGEINQFLRDRIEKDLADLRNRSHQTAVPRI